jgi:uncharacterized protein YecE (DUF72 family)
MRRWFEFYSQHFHTLELNVTFYRFPQLNWYTQAPEGFQFAVKAPQLITHYKQFHGVGQLLGDFYDTTGRGLLDKLGPVLFQMPPRMAYDADRLTRILDCLDLSFVNVLEFRHPSWWREEVYEALRQRGVAFSGQSHPQLPDAIIATSPTLYYRFHGVPDLYASPYPLDFLQRVATEVITAPGVEQAYLYFNNDIGGSAIGNAQEMRGLINGQQ